MVVVKLIIVAKAFNAPFLKFNQLFLSPSFVSVFYFNKLAKIKQSIFCHQGSFYKSQQVENFKLNHHLKLLKSIFKVIEGWAGTAALATDACCLALVFWLAATAALLTLSDISWLLPKISLNSLGWLLPNFVNLSRAASCRANLWVDTVSVDCFLVSSTRKWMSTGMERLSSLPCFPSSERVSRQSSRSRDPKAKDNSAWLVGSDRVGPRHHWMTWRYRISF